jgi:hypothetical protein
MFLCTSQAIGNQAKQRPSNPRAHDQRGAASRIIEGPLSEVFEALVVSRRHRAEIEIEQHCRLRKEVLKK